MLKLIEEPAVLKGLTKHLPPKMSFAGAVKHGKSQVTKSVRGQWKPRGRGGNRNTRPKQDNSEEKRKYIPRDEKLYSRSDEKVEDIEVD